MGKHAPQGYEGGNMLLREMKGETCFWGVGWVSLG